MVLKIKISRNLFECLFRTFMHNPSTVQLKTWTKTILPPAGHCGTLGNALLPSTTRNLGTIIESVGCMFGEENLFFLLKMVSLCSLGVKCWDYRHVPPYPARLSSSLLYICSVPLNTDLHRLTCRCERSQSTSGWEYQPASDGTYPLLFCSELVTFTYSLGVIVATWFPFIVKKPFVWW